MQLNLDGFQPCDVRGLYGEGPDAQISPYHAFLIGRAVATRVPPGAPIVMAGDGRASTPVLMAALRHGLARSCVDLGPGVPTPLAYLAKQRLAAHTSLVVTASHNPPDFNGIKLQLGDRPITPGELAAIRTDVGRLAQQGGRPPDGMATPTPAAVTRPRELSATWETYLSTVAEAFPRMAGQRLVVDCMHGSYSGWAGEALAASGHSVTGIRDDCRPDFGGITPDPSEKANLTALMATVTAGEYCFGAALDGDGDRARFVDECGEPVDNGTILVLLTRAMLGSAWAGKRRTVVYDQKIRLAVVDALREAGAKPVRERSGHTFIRARVLREQALLGGEESGHLFWGGAPYAVPAGDCGLFAVFAVAWLLRENARSLSELVGSMPRSPFYTGDIRGLRCSGDRAELLTQTSEAAARSGCSVGTEDGVRIEKPGAFVHLRPSVTESDMLTATFDAREARGLADMLGLLTDALPPQAEAIGRAIRQRVAPLLARAST